MISLFSWWKVLAYIFPLPLKHSFTSIIGLSQVDNVETKINTDNSPNLALFTYFTMLEGYIWRTPIRDLLWRLNFMKSLEPWSIRYKFRKVTAWIHIFSLVQLNYLLNMKYMQKKMFYTTITESMVQCCF